MYVQRVLEGEGVDVEVGAYVTGRRDRHECKGRPDWGTRV